MKYLIILFSLTTNLIFGQSASDVGFQKQNVRLTIANVYKGQLGTMLFAIGYKPANFLEVSVGPTYGIFWGGAGFISSINIPILSKHDFFFNFEISERHTFFRHISYENHNYQDRKEFYRLPDSDYIVFGIGINHKLKKGEEDDDARTVVNATLNYNQAFRNYHYSYAIGPTSLEGEAIAKKVLGSGLGFSISVTFDLFKHHELPESGW